MNVRKLILLLATGCLATAALAQTPAEFKEMTDSLKARIQRRTTVRNGVALSKVARRGKSLDFHFKSGLGEVPWRSADVAWLRKDIKASLPDKYQGYEVGEIYVGTADIATLVIPEAGNNGKPDCRTFRTRDPRGQVPFVEAVGGQRFEKGLTGRNIALWQSHGRYYEEKFDRWEWQRAPLFRTVEDMYTQSYVLPFLIPMLENAGAYVMTPRERDIQRREVVADNDPAFEDERTDGTRLQGAYQEKGSWSDAGTGFADRKKTYSSRLENPFRMGTARMARCDNRRSHRAVARWTPDIPERGEYAVYVSYKTLPGSTDKAHYTVRHLGGESEFYVNQRMGGGTWIYLGTFPFAEGEEGCVLLDNTLPDGAKGETVTADAVRFGGGIGKIARGRKDASPDTYTTSGLPCFAEGAYYWMQWAGADTTILNLHEDDYTSDYADRGAWVGWMSGGSRTNPKAEGKGIPIDMSFAFHTDAGTTKDDSIIGTLSIYTLMCDGSDKLPNGESRLQQRMYADYVQTQLVEDVRRCYNPSWSRRLLWDRSYSESRTTTVPAMLLEFLSHQNFADMKYGLDPSFRFAASRAIYKGMLKYLSSRYGCEYAVQPLPVNSFATSFTKAPAAGSPATVRLCWKPTRDSLEATADPTGYILYTRLDDGAFDDGRILEETAPYGDFCSTEVEIQPGHVYSYRIVAFNEGGKSFPSEVLSVGVPASGNGGSVIVVNNFTRVSPPAWFDTPEYAGFDNGLDGGVPYVSEINFIGEQYQFRRDMPWTDDDNPGFGGSYTDKAGTVIPGNTFDFTAIHGRAMMAAGHPFHSSSSAAFCGNVFLCEGDYAADIICGKQVTTMVGSGTKPAKYEIFPARMRTALGRFTSSGGNVLVSGSNIGTDVWDRVFPVRKDSLEREEAKLFVQEVLGYRWLTNYATRSAVARPMKSAGIDLSGTGRSFSFWNVSNPRIYHVETPDGIVPASDKASTFLRYSDTNISAGTCMEAGPYRSVCLGFPIETIKEQSDIDCLIAQILEYFDKAED
jgi:hypothetical protein